MAKKQKFVNLPRGGYRLGSGKDNFMNTVQVEAPNRNSFDLSHAVKTTGRVCNLMPVLCLETVPGDKFNIGCDILTRLAPMIAPIMDQFTVRVEYFHSPNRIVWPESGANLGWEKFIANEPAVTRPFITIDAGVAAWEDFLDYFRIPPFSSSAGGVAQNISALPFAHYQKIYQDYYRPQYLENEMFVPLVDGDNNAVIADLLDMRRRCYDNDYFTANLPTPQKGAAGVTIPGGTVVFDPTALGGANIPMFQDAAVGSPTGDLVQVVTGIETSPAGNSPLGYDPDGTLRTTGTLNELREANAIQKWLEMLMRVGSRYKELIKGAFDVDVEDFRVARPEFICGVKSPVIVSEVLNTTGETGGIPQGNMAGHGIAVIEGYQDGYYCKEHGYIIGILSIMPRATYCHGIERHWLRDSPNDFYWPHFANLGEQATFNAELTAYTGTPTGTFGYMPRYSELRVINDYVGKDFRPDTGNLPFWTMARNMNGVNAPALDRTFLDVDDGDVERIFAAAGTDDYFYFHLVHKINASRPIPVYGTPQLI